MAPAGIPGIPGPGMPGIPGIGAGFATCPGAGCTGAGADDSQPTSATSPNRHQPRCRLIACSHRGGSARARETERRRSPQPDILVWRTADDSSRERVSFCPLLANDKKTGLAQRWGGFRGGIGHDLPPILLVGQGRWFGVTHLFHEELNDGLGFFGQRLFPVRRGSYRQRIRLAIGRRQSRRRCRSRGGW